MMSETPLNTVSADGLFSIFYGNDLERYRALSLRDKEPETVNWIENFFCNGDIFFDVGANIGVYSLFAAAQFPNLNIYSFEPFYKNYCRINENINLNKFQNINAFPIAFSDFTLTSTFHSKDLRSGGSGGQVGRNIDEFGNFFEPIHKQAVLSFKLDDFLSFFEIPCPNYIKVDVDGVEHLILKGMAKTLKRNELKSILIELNMPTNHREQFIRNMNDLGFSLDNPFNNFNPHSRERRSTPAGGENIAENLIFTKK
jgi:FkbM family methyltransferase